VFSSATFSESNRPLRVNTISPFAALSILSIWPHLKPRGHYCNATAKIKLLKINDLTVSEMASPHQLANCCTQCRLQFAGKKSRNSLLFFEGYGVLKRFLLIFNDLIFDSRVDRGMPSLAAAPDGPNTRPPLSFRAASIISFSCAASF